MGKKIKSIPAFSDKMANDSRKGFPNRIVRGAVRRFFLPDLTTGFLIRASFVALFAYLFFSQVCLPFRIQGVSMEPTYRDGEFHFCWQGRYLFSEPGRFKVVAIRLAGSGVMLLKRVVALEGEEIEFRAGNLYINGKEMEEPYVRHKSDWNLLPRRVEKENVFVVGDNRGVSIDNHYLGQTSRKRIVGGPLW